MTIEVVDPTKIEEIVGIERHSMAHYGRAVSSDQTFYILHSQMCLDSGRDLLGCQFSIALAEGINPQTWSSALDRPVRIGFDGTGRLAPHDMWEGQIG